MRNFWDFALTCVAGTLSMFGFLAGLACFLNWLTVEPTNLPQQIYNAVWFLCSMVSFLLTAVAGMWGRMIWVHRPVPAVTHIVKQTPAPLVDIRVD